MYLSLIHIQMCIRDRRNVTQVDARMYVNLPDQTPSDAIVYTYDKEEYDIFSKQKKECIYCLLYTST